MVVAVQQPLAECTAIFTLYIVKHRSPPCTVKIHKAAQIYSGTDSKDSKIKGQCAGNTKHFDLSQ